VKGEFTVIVGKWQAPVDESIPLEREVELLIAQGVPRMNALKQVARRRGISKREVYKSLDK
jgi:16S rRNA C1402 (ribose-2'-O) methylase RsmI